MSDMQFYDLQKTFSYNKKLDFIISARGYGKTFGTRQHYLECSKMQTGKQTRLDLEGKRHAAKIDKTIWQPETALQPWAVHVEGWTNGKVDVTLYHAVVDRKGSVTFPNLHLDNADAFATFCQKIIGVYAQFRGDIEFRTKDYVALRNGYAEGVRNATRLLK